VFSPKVKSRWTVKASSTVNQIGWAEKYLCFNPCVEKISKTFKKYWILFVV